MREPKLDVHPLSVEDAHLFVKTRSPEIRKKVYSLLEDPSLFFHKIYAVMGGFGSGKTTIVNYIRYSFRCKGCSICPIDIAWKPVVSKIRGPHEIRKWFIEDMRGEMLEACDGAMLAALPNQVEDLKKVASRLADKEGFDERQIIACLKELSPYYDGFAILLDELHRITEYQHVLDFLKFEQSIFQEACKYPVVIFVACPNEWLKNLELDEYSGIFDEYVHLPTWKNAQEARELIDRRLMDAAAEPSRFESPLSRGALAKIAGFPNVNTPRDWIKYAKRIFENLPESVTQINASVVADAISFVDTSTLSNIRRSLFEFPAAQKLISSILKSPASEARRLLNIVARLYRQPLPRPLTEEVNEKMNIKDFPMLLRSLIDLKIVVRDSQSSPPIKSEYGAVEITVQKTYRLNQKLAEFFEEVEERWGLDPEDYILRFVEGTTPATQVEARGEDEQNLKRMKLIAENLEMPRAQNHILRAMEDYQAFIGAAFSASPIDRPDLRSGMMAIYNIVAAFSVEKTKDEQHLVNMEEDLGHFQEVLMPGKALVRTAVDLYREFREIEDTGKPINKGMSNAIKRKVPEIISRLTTQLDRWASLPAPTRDHKEVLEKIQAIQARISRPQSVVRNNTILYLKTLAQERTKSAIDEQWLKAFFKMLEQREIDKTLMEIVDIRYDPQLHHRDVAQAYKTALSKLGLVFENVLMIIGRNHADAKIKKTFWTKPRLNVKYMLNRLFAKDEILKAVLNLYGDFDRSKNGKDFEKKAQKLLGKKGDELPRYARFYALSTLVRNYYSHEGCQDTIANTDEQVFVSILNEGLFSAVNVFKFFADRDMIVGFKV